MSRRRWEWRYVYTEVAVFLGCCCAAGCLLGLAYAWFTSPLARQL